MIRICLVDDQRLVLQGIRSLLELVDDFEIVGEAADGEEALSVIPACKPDVVLLDLRMPKLDGIGVLEALSERQSLPPTLILTTFDDDELVLKGIRAGARGYLLKDVSLEQLSEAIRTLAGGGTLINPAVTDRLLRGLQRMGTGASDESNLGVLEALTRREREILRLVAGGYSNREIGEALSVAEGTVKNHVSSILSKLGVRDRVRAVLKGLELKLI